MSERDQWAGLPVRESDAMMRGCWMGYDAAGRVVVCGAGSKVLRSSDEPVASIVASTDVYAALQALPSPPANSTGESRG